MGNIFLLHVIYKMQDLRIILIVMIKIKRNMVGDETGEKCVILFKMVALILCCSVNLYRCQRMEGAHRIFSFNVLA